jgi:hypothetical protein
MQCYECSIEVEPTHYPEGVCPRCGDTYILPDEEFPQCSECGNYGSDPCLDCLIDETVDTK